MHTNYRIVLALLMLSFASALNAAVPGMISYQGKLLQPSGAPVPDGTYSIQFAVYDAPTGGTPLWSEVNTSIQVKGGLFATMLGSTVNLPANLFDNPNRFFAIRVGTDPEMTPRQPVASSAFAFRSAIAATVDDAAVVTSKIADAAVTAAKLAPGVAIPPGGVIMWSGAADQIPQGWALCDGQNGTPDLRNRFIVGAGGEYAVAAVGGEKLHQLTVGEMPSHTHIQNAHTHTQNPHAHSTQNGFYIDTDRTPNLVNAVNGGTHSDWSSAVQPATATNQNATATNQNTGGDQPHENRPPYYALCFIMKLGY